MGHISIIYGNIIGPSWKTTDHHKLQRLNKTVIENLLVTDEGFPWLTQHMFLAPDPDKDPMYREQVIVFGASYKSVEYEWEQWLDKFEAILRQLYWSSATVQLETELVGNHTYQWLADINQPGNWTADDPHPTTLWEFGGGPRNFNL